MQIRVEFFGIPRRRAGCDHALVTLDADVVSLGRLVSLLAERFPNLAAECFDLESPDAPRLRAGCAANVGGQRFVRDPNFVLSADQTLLILSADAGG